MEYHSPTVPAIVGDARLGEVTCALVLLSARFKARSLSPSVPVMERLADRDFNLAFDDAVIGPTGHFVGLEAHDPPRGFSVVQPRALSNRG
jgi:hypothetical protein